MTMRAVILIARSTRAATIQTMLVPRVSIWASRYRLSVPARVIR
jgi:hypothetical protein